MKKKTKTTNKDIEALQVANEAQELSLTQESEVLSVSETPLQETEKATVTPKKIKRKRRVSQAFAVRYDNGAMGLTLDQVEDRIATGLTNKVKTRNSKSIPSIIIGNTFTFFNLLCALVLAAYAFVNTSFANFTFIIPFAVNLIIGIIQEIRAKISIEKLSILQAPITKVVRNGIEVEISSKDVVLDDVFKIVSGNQIPVDGIVIEGYAEVNEALLTGESVAVKKNVGDSILAGSFVTSGAITARADKVGEECYVQKLTSQVKKYKKPNSQLMATLTGIVKVVGLLIIPIAIGIGLVNFNHASDPGGVELGETIEHFVVTRTGAVILGMIPAGLILLTTMALSLGVIRLYKRNTLVQDMYSLEMLARVDCLCLDKTGTITDGRMQVVKDFVLAERHPHQLCDIIGTMQSVFEDNNATSSALRAKYIPQKDFIVIKKIPFSSARKYSAVTFSETGTYALGAPEFVIKDLPENIKELISNQTTRGNRVLLLAHSNAQITSKGELPTTMKPIALIVLSDNIRSEAIDTIKWFKENGVAVKVISGDNPITVSEIAKRAGVDNATNWISLEGLSDKEVASIASKYTVFGRVSPEQKCVLIKALKMGGHTVAMTGDGVNDILAMRESDCAITVATGADAAKSCSHIVLADNNFNSMPQVVAEGRRVINNIQQSASLFLMKTVFITLLALISIATNSFFPFATGHLTILEIFVIGFASLALSIQPNDKKVEGDFLTTIFSNAIPGGLILLLNVYIVEFISMFGIFESENLIMTMKIVGFTLGGLIYLYKVCKPMNVFRAIIFGIVTFCISIWVIFLLDTTAILHLPTNFFGLTALFPTTLQNWQYVLILIAVIEFNLLIVEPLSKLNRYVMGAFRKKSK